MFLTWSAIVAGGGAGLFPCRSWSLGGEAQGGEAESQSPKTGAATEQPSRALAASRHLSSWEMDPAMRGEGQQEKLTLALVLEKAGLRTLVVVLKGVLPVCPL